MRFAYADPPYVGQARRHYDCEEIDHRVLINRLCSEFPDGWALSASSPSLRGILPICPPDVRLGAWVKSFCAFKRGVRPAYAWEPVIFRGGRNPSNGYRAEIPPKNGKQVTPKDFIVAPITLRRGLVGAKPERVCRWILDLLNVQPGDEVIDLYPGTGVMGRVAKTVCGAEGRRDKDEDEDLEDEDEETEDEDEEEDDEDEEEEEDRPKKKKKSKKSKKKKSRDEDDEDEEEDEEEEDSDERR